MKVSVWARSPSPSAKKSKDATKAASAKPVEASKNDVKDEFGRDAVARKEEGKAKKEKVESSSESSSDSSSSSSSDSSSESSDSSVDRRKKSSSRKKKSSSKHHSKSKKSSKKSKSKGKSKSRKHSKRRRDSSYSSDSSSDSSSSDSDSEHASKKRKSSSSRTESKPSLDAPVGGNFDEFDKDEMSRFRMEVQGGKTARSAGASGGTGYDSESDDDQDFGPMPMVQPKEYGEDKRVSKLWFINDCSILFLIKACVLSINSCLILSICAPVRHHVHIYSFVYLCILIANFVFNTAELRRRFAARRR